MCWLAKAGGRRIRGQSQEGQGSSTRAARIAITVRHMVIMAGLCWLRRNRGVALAGVQRCKDKRNRSFLRWGRRTSRRVGRRVGSIVDVGQGRLSRCFHGAMSYGGRRRRGRCFNGNMRIGRRVGRRVGSIVDVGQGRLSRCSHGAMSHDERRRRGWCFHGNMSLSLSRRSYGAMNHDGRR